jgi:hypothetical protein
VKASELHILGAPLYFTLSSIPSYIHLGILHFKKMDPKPDLSFLFWHQTAK